MAQTSKGNVLAHRQRAVPEESVSLECAKAAPFAYGQMQVFLSVCMPITRIIHFVVKYLFLALFHALEH